MKEPGVEALIKASDELKDVMLEDDPGIIINVSPEILALQNIAVLEEKPQSAPQEQGPALSTTFQASVENVPVAEILPKPHAQIEPRSKVELNPDYEALKLLIPENLDGNAMRVEKTVMGKAGLIFSRLKQGHIAPEHMGELMEQFEGFDEGFPDGVRLGDFIEKLKDVRMPLTHELNAELVSELQELKEARMDHVEALERANPDFIALRVILPENMPKNAQRAEHIVSRTVDNVFKALRNEKIEPAHVDNLLKQFRSYDEKFPENQRVIPFLEKMRDMADRAEPIMSEQIREFYNLRTQRRNFVQELERGPKQAEQSANDKSVESVHTVSNASPQI